MTNKEMVTRSTLDMNSFMKAERYDLDIGFLDMTSFLRVAATISCWVDSVATSFK